MQYVKIKLQQIKTKNSITQQLFFLDTTNVEQTFRELLSQLNYLQVGQ